MALPASGPISFNNINVELGVAGTTQASLGQASYRTLAGVPSGAISMSNFYGKANQFAFSIASNQTNANLRTLALNAGWNGTSKVVATINSGIYVSSNSTGTPALTVSGSFPNGVDLINNGFIVGMGGRGGNGTSTSLSTASGGQAGFVGGVALSVSSAISITNNGTVAGGGGGGGGGGSGRTTAYYGTAISGGGGGGGRSSNAANSSGGSGGVSTGANISGRNYSGSAGNSGTVSSQGSGGSAGFGGNTYDGVRGGAGGSGGGWGANGSSGVSGTESGSFSGGGAGNYATGNSNITWVATGTRLGGVS